MACVVQAQSEYEAVEIQLVTVGTGEAYWSAFGHSAIRVKANNYDKMFGFGYFNFADEDFLSNFASGKMRYYLGISDAKEELAGYVKEDRLVLIQSLKFTAAQKQHLLEKLLYLAEEENRYYHYDYFLNNCTSKIRDLVDEVTDGELSSQLMPIETQMSWSDYTLPVSNQAWMNLGIAYIYGIVAYQDKSKWQLAVFPEVFADDIKNLPTTTAWNSDYQVYYQPSYVHKHNTLMQWLASHYANVLLVVLLLLGLSFKKTHKPTKVLWLITQTVLAIGLLLLWFFSHHSVAGWNINVLIFSPIAILLLFKWTNKPWLYYAFIGSNVVWIILALWFTNWYLMGFCVVNLVLAKNHTPA